MLGKKNTDYLRLYCEHCNRIYGKKAYGVQSYCTQCQQHLILKNFSPWSNLFNTVAGAITLFILYIVSSLVVTAALSLIGVAGWNVMIYAFVLPLGAVIWAFKNSAHGFEQWKQIQKLDKE